MIKTKLLVVIAVVLVAILGVLMLNRSDDKAKAIAEIKGDCRVSAGDDNNLLERCIETKLKARGF